MKMTRRTVLVGLGSVAAVGCGGASTDGRAPTSKDPTGFEFNAARPGLDRGQKAPPLPPDLDIWTWDAGGFVGDPIWYGERDWDGVRMRLMGHLAWLGRDRCRRAAQRGALPEARAELVQAQRDLSACAPRRRGTVTAGLHAALQKVLQRDLELLDGIAGKPIKPGLDAAGVIGLALSGEDPNPVLERLASPPQALDLDSFTNFDDRHRLRVQQWVAWGVMADPLGLVPTWGHFDRRAWVRWHRSLVERLGALRGVSEQTGRLQALTRIGPVETVDPTVAELGALPTGDSLIDSAGEPGPRAIGELWSMGADDAAYQGWLAGLSAELTELVSSDPDGFTARVRAAVQAVDAHSHGSRFYNVKQLRNVGMRALAARGHFKHARTLLKDHLPLHNQDWACPNRLGILQAIDGRLALVGGLDDAAQRLSEASESARAFVADIAQAEQDPTHGLRPPGFGQKGKARPGKPAPSSP
ncbi:MAG: hypothetical protein CMJ34_13965 [Phycisphaerae bacterium]|nr:hypothetical protein [Phycisphaerae bacterium]